MEVEGTYGSLPNPHSRKQGVAGGRQPPAPDRNKDLVNGIAYGTMGGAIGGAVGGLIGAEIAGGAIGAGVGIVYLIAQSTKDATR